MNMTKATKTISAILGLLVLLAVGLKGFFLYQQKYVCEPKEKQAISNFIAAVAASSYESLGDKSMFVNKEQFTTFKSKISRDYTVEVKEWLRPTEPAVLVHFSSGASYALVLVVGHDLLPVCWGTQYRVLTVG